MVRVTVLKFARAFAKVSDEGLSCLTVRSSLFWSNELCLRIFRKTNKRSKDSKGLDNQVRACTSKVLRVKECFSQREDTLGI